MSSADHRIYFQLQRAAHSLQKRADRVLIEAAGISTTQAAALAVISRDGPVSQRRIAALLGTNESALTGLASRLLQLGLIEKSRDPADSRAWLLTMTGKGDSALKAAERAFGPVNAALDAALGPLPAEAFGKALKAISQI